MTNRLPSRSQLDAMSVPDAWQILQVLADDAKYERSGILDGSIRLSSNLTRRSALEYNRRRLKRIYSAADGRGVYVGQPHGSAA